MKKILTAIFLLVLCGMLSCQKTFPQLPEYGQEFGHIDDIPLREDQLRFRIKMEMRGLPRDVITPEFIKNITDKLIQDYTIIAYGKKKNLLPNDESLEKQFQDHVRQWNPKALDELLLEAGISYNRFRELILDRLRVRAVIDAELSQSIQPTRSEVERYYWQNIKNYEAGERVRVRHIVTESNEKAKDIMTRINKGDNFAKLAVHHSISPDRTKGGDLGYFEKGTYPKVFDDVCFKLEKGQVSEIVKSEYGYHIFKMLDKMPPARKNLTEVAGEIAEHLSQEKLAKAYEKWYSQIEKEVSKTIDQKMIETMRF